MNDGISSTAVIAACCSASHMPESMFVLSVRSRPISSALPTANAIRQPGSESDLESE